MKRAGVIFALGCSAALALLGCLWTAQGLGLVTIDPIACIGDCTPVRGPNTRWVITGTLTVIAGLAGSILLTRMLRQNEGAGTDRPAPPSGVGQRWP